MVQATQNCMHAMTWFTVHMMLYTHRIHVKTVVSKESITCLAGGVKCTQIIIAVDNQVDVMLITNLHISHHLWVKLTHSGFTYIY